MDENKKQQRFNGDFIDLNDWNDWGHNCGAPK